MGPPVKPGDDRKNRAEERQRGFNHHLSCFHDELDEPFGCPVIPGGSPVF
ncbi:MAG: hypothetical protein LBQ58_03710 [Synergistaceae bacterium]|nr:hypothetical protein [Synergistaceae bacterium]